MILIYISVLNFNVFLPNDVTKHRFHINVICNIQDRTCGPIRVPNALSKRNESNGGDGKEEVEEKKTAIPPTRI